MKILKRSHKNLMIFEAGFIYCKRRNINYDEDEFIYGILMSDSFDCEENSEFDNICKDLRCFRYFETYKLIEITEQEYDECVDKFNKHSL